MSATELQFRTSALGGFHKQDVLDYIDRSNKEHTERVVTADRELEELRRAKGDLEAACENSKAQGETLTAEVARLAAQLEESTARQEELSARVTELEGALDEAKARLAKAEPAAEAYESIKDRTAGVELEAHHRANAVQEAAEVQVRKTHSEVEQWLHSLQAAYGDLRATMDGHVAAATAELEQVRQSIDSISKTFGTEQNVLAHLGDLCRENLGPRAPQPLPLDGDEI